MTYTTNKHYFDESTLDNSYWAGFLAADGCLWKRGDAVEISLQERDLTHLQALADDVCYGGGPTKRKSAGSYYSKQDCYRTWIKSVFDTLFPSVQYSVVRKSSKGKQYIYRFSGRRAVAMQERLKKLCVPKMERKWHKKLIHV